VRVQRLNSADRRIKPSSWLIEGTAKHFLCNLDPIALDKSLASYTFMISRANCCLRPLITICLDLWMEFKFTLACT
jgi:hypothetical protein